MKKNKNEIIGFVDGFDVIITNKSELMIKHFQQLQCDIIFGWEASNNNLLCYLLSFILFKHAKNLRRNDFPNSGVYIGYVEEL